MDDIKQTLLDNNISPSFHRIKIYEYLLKNKTHPSADIIYTDIIREIPTLSKTTIYNTLKSFTEKGLIHTLTIDETEVRFESTLHFHAHFICTACGAIIDIDHTPLKESLPQLKDHEIHETHLYYRGICKKCKK